MKRMLKQWMEIEVIGLDLDNVSRIDIVAQQYRDGGVRKVDTWINDGGVGSSAGTCLRGTTLDPDQTPAEITGYTNSIYVPWKREDTEQFRRGDTFWLDVRPVNGAGGAYPDIEVAPVEVLMCDSLFTAEEVNDE